MNVLGIRIETVPGQAARRRSAAVAVLATANIAVLGTGAAWAVWSTTGTGIGTAKAGALSLTVGTAAPATSLYPSQKSDVALTVTNNSGVPLKLASNAVVLAAPSASPTAGGSGCPATNLSVPSPAPTISPTTIPTNSTATITVSNGVQMDVNAPDACQGAAISLTATVTGTN